MKFAILLALVVLTGCTSYSGRVLDSATLSMEGVREVIVPHDAEVTKDGAIGKLELSMDKSREIEDGYSHFEDIDWVRRKMGVATHRDDYKLELATFGEFDNAEDGKAAIRLGVRVADGITITRKQGNSGPNSSGNDASREWVKHVGD